MARPLTLRSTTVLAVMVLVACLWYFTGVYTIQSWTLAKDYACGPSENQQKSESSETISSSNFVDKEADNTDVVTAYEKLAAKCEDPYRLPGYLYLPELEEDYRETRWIPFRDTFHELPALAGTVYPPENNDTEAMLLANNEIGSEFFDAAPTSWMKRLVIYHNISNKVEQAKRLEKPLILSTREREIMRQMKWVNNRRVLYVGDSVDRIPILSLCEELGLEMVSDGGPVHGKRQTTVYCHVPSINFTVVQWHVPGMLTFRPDWWWEKEMSIVAFEERFEEIYLKYSLPLAINPAGKAPDLVFVQTGLWDERAIRYAEYFAGELDGEETPNANRTRIPWSLTTQLTWTQLRFINVRFQKLVHKLQDMFGEETPIMYRSLTMRKDSKLADLPVISIDRMHRSMAKHLNLEVFDWGRLIYGHSNYFKDQMHVLSGPLTWLWNDMMLGYLFRAAGGVEEQGKIVQWPEIGTAKSWNTGENWNRCHRYLTGNDNR
ncbi:hypothetical protein BZA70DRAFT_12005 [Myxozyma melibiosi]|uniref:Uncharacterized protein n=1 Tax=Myxozyma melibiosi TaxID=54550 RepID=A0ABR1FBZ5_9ASCO